VTAAADLSYLSPDRLSLGGTGVFAGDWAATGSPAEFPVGFIGVLIDWWNGWAVFSCTREVAEVIVADQQQARDQYEARYAAEGKRGSDLAAAVDEAIPALRFDGDDVVLDDPANSDTQRFSPDPDGNYVICGWFWTWLAVDPASCARIVGAVPADGEHRRWVQLRHSDLRVPHNRLRVTGVEVPVHEGGPATATLTLDGVPIGTAEVEAGVSRLRLSDNTLDQNEIDQFVAVCRRHGRLACENQVLRALINEYEIDVLISDVEREDATLVRQRDGDGNTNDLLRVVGHPDAASLRATVARYLTRQPHLTHGDGWLSWTGGNWRSLGPISAANPMAFQPR
jgi:hypothetical protein